MAEEKKQPHWRIDIDIFKELEGIAKKEIRSTNAQAEYFISQGIEQYKINQAKKKKSNKSAL